MRTKSTLSKGDPAMRGGLEGAEPAYGVLARGTILRQPPPLTGGSPSAGATLVPAWRRPSAGDPTSCSWSPTRNVSDPGCRRTSRSPGATGFGPTAWSSPITSPTRRRVLPAGPAMFTGRYLAGHGVVDNVIMPEHHELPTTTPTLGSLLQDAGYRSSYIGKWHLSHSPTPDMEAYGFADWDGNDRHFMGWAGTGVHFDPIIATNAAHWIEKNASAAGTPPAATRPAPALVPHRCPGQPTRRDVVPGRPARLPRAPSRRCGRHPSRARGRRLEGRRPPPYLRRSLPRGGRPTARQLRRRPPHQAGGAPAVAVGPAARSVGLHRPRGHRLLAPPPRLLRAPPTAG